MSQMFETGSSYFDLPRRPRDSSGSSEKTSPLTLPSPSPTNRICVRSVRPRLAEEHRSHSNTTLPRSRPQFETIREETLNHDSASCMFGRGESPQNRVLSIGTPKCSRSSSRLSVQGAIEQSPKKPSQPSNASDSASKREHHTEEKANAQGRSPSGNARKTTSDIDPDSSFASKAEFIIESTHPTSIRPLRPPVTETSLSFSRSNPNIRIEKTFTTFEPERTGIRHSKSTSQTSRGASSIKPRQIFSHAIKVFRRIRRSLSEECVTAGEPTLLKRRDLEANHSDHQTSLQRGVAAAGLKRVSCILQDFKSLGARGRTASDRTASSDTSWSLRSQSWYGKHTRMRLAERARSMDMQVFDPDSPASSLRRLQRGITPHNTPEEKATYTVLSKNGQATEYLKIDISVRGETSYLPSEARRIHTPPNPSRGLDGKARGFFFDYSGPDKSQREVLQNGEFSLKRRNQGSPRSRESCSSTASHVPTISHGFAPRDTRDVTKVQAGNWYGTQLAEIDSSQSAAEGGDQSPRSELSEDTILPVSNDEEFDQSIPEHLPTSPLCPRHPRYWRIVKNKGSQFRGCWMHGLEEFSVEEKVRYGIK